MASNWENWQRDIYHPNFQKRARYRKKRVKYTCEHCGAKQGDERMSKGGRAYKVMVAAAHVNHDPHRARAQLIILCQLCHLRHDAIEHGKNMRRTKYRQKREAALQAGQLELPLKVRKGRVNACR